MFCPLVLPIVKDPSSMENYTIHGRTSLDGFDVPVTPHVYYRLYHVIGCPWSSDESLNQLAPQLKRAGDATDLIHRTLKCTHTHTHTHIVLFT